MITKKNRWHCICGKCGHAWETRNDGLPDKCPNQKCKSKNWNTGYVEIPEPTLMEMVARLSCQERLDIFAGFELCCGMRLGQCICPEEVTVLKTTPETLESLRALIAPFNDDDETDVDAEGGDWVGWSEEREEYDEVTGETIIYRKQLRKPFRMQEIRREH